MKIMKTASTDSITAQLALEELITDIGTRWYNPPIETITKSENHAKNCIYRHSSYRKSRVHHG